MGGHKELSVPTCIAHLTLLSCIPFDLCLISLEHLVYRGGGRGGGTDEKRFVCNQTVLD